MAEAPETRTTAVQGASPPPTPEARGSGQSGHLRGASQTRPGAAGRGCPLGVPGRRPSLRPAASPAWPPSPRGRRAARPRPRQRGRTATGLAAGRPTWQRAQSTGGSRGTRSPRRDTAGARASPLGVRAASQRLKHPGDSARRRDWSAPHHAPDPQPIRDRTHPARACLIASPEPREQRRSAALVFVLPPPRALA